MDRLIILYLPVPRTHEDWGVGHCPSQLLWWRRPWTDGRRDAILYAVFMWGPHNKASHWESEPLDELIRLCLITRYSRRFCGPLIQVA